MVRAPCCEKMGLKKGPWTREEDQILVDYITIYGHGNWRALPKLAGLLRCGKSCRLRWTNYLRPDIKRGNFSREEEDVIINLHGLLGNRWSAIAARLPGRTDNEIKNVWHTHLKKRLKHLDVMITSQSKKNNPTKKKPQFEENDRPKEEEEEDNDDEEEREPKKANFTSEKLYNHPNSPQHSLSSSIVTSTSSGGGGGDDMCMDGSTDKILDSFGELLDEDFWVEVFSTISGETKRNLPAGYDDEDTKIQRQNTPLNANELSGCGYNNNNNISNLHHHHHDGMDFWYDIFTRAAGELPKLPDFL